VSAILRIGSRGSQLALWQAHHVAGLLRGRGHEVEIEVIKTTGDRLQTVTFAQVGATIPKGMFTLEIEEALAAGRIDLAVHSLKDLPTELPREFVLGATPKRVDPRDVLVSRDHASFQDLPAGARVGTSSLRRRAQLRAIRPDLEYVEFRGNVDTRLRKLGDGQAEAILLAAAGLDRLEKTEWVRERIEPEVVCPAAGQGALGIEIRAQDARVSEIVAFLDDPVTRFAVTAERVALAALGGGCQVPIGVHCRALNLHPLTENGFGSPRGDRYEILGAVADPEGSRVLRSNTSGNQAEDLGRAVAADLLQQGASELFEGIGTH
jgi:hydroxymethylbilane synthase